MILSSKASDLDFADKIDRFAEIINNNLDLFADADYSVTWKKGIPTIEIRSNNPEIGREVPLILSPSVALSVVESPAAIRNCPEKDIVITALTKAVNNSMN